MRLRSALAVSMPPLRLYVAVDVLPVSETERLRATLTVPPDWFTVEVVAPPPPLARRKRLPTVSMVGPMSPPAVGVPL